MSNFKMIVGLGNPGRRYENNRHNIGFRAVELFAENYGIDFDKTQHKARTGQGWVERKQLQEDTAHRTGANLSRSNRDRASISVDSAWQIEAAREKVLLVKPQTFMNNSGEAIRSLASYYSTQAEDILVIHDHLDLPMAKLSYRAGGGAGGQNGVRSVIRHLGHQNFPRLRIGIGRPPDRMDAAAYVLQDFTRAEASLFAEIADLLVDSLNCWIFEGIDSVMNAFNGLT